MIGVALSPVSGEAEPSAFGRTRARLRLAAHRRPTPPRRTRGRTAVAVGVAVFLAGQVLLNLAIRAEWLAVRDPVYFEKLGRLEGHPAFLAPHSGTPRVIALGSSRTQLGFDAGRLGDALAARGRPVEAFNFGCPAAGPMTAALYFRRLLEAGARPDYLLVEIHPGFCTPADPPFEARWLHTYRLRPGEIDTLRGFGWAVAPPPHHGWKGWVNAAHAFRYALLNRYAPVMLPCPYGLTNGDRTDGRGFMPGVEVPAGEKPRALERTYEAYAPVLQSYRANGKTGGPGCAAIRDTLARCREHGVTAAVVLMPESGEHRAWYGAAGLAAVGDLAAGMGRDYEVPVIDAREWVPDDGFADGHHLTPRGAAAYTDRLAGFVGGWVRGKGESGRRGEGEATR